MADSSPHPDPGDGAGFRNEREAPLATPRWVKASAAIALALGLVVAVMLLAGGGLGNHGPGRHSGDAPPPGIAEDHAPPPGVDHAAP